ncbi:MAG: hypothetical protein KDD40_01460 [Bdellovibrionales bacterium]|nr:hypothetical protein [Bdellovibrionales bacterium]
MKNCTIHLIGSYESDLLKHGITGGIEDLVSKVVSKNIKFKAMWMPDFAACVQEGVHYANSIDSTVTVQRYINDSLDGGRNIDQNLYLQEVMVHFRDADTGFTFDTTISLTQ